MENKKIQNIKEKNHCQICEREIRAKIGTIAHHGYTRPESGWQTDSCMGARNLPYEKSRDIIPLAITKIDSFIFFIEEEIKQIEAENLPVPFLNKIMINLDNPIYKIRQKEHIEKLKCQIKMVQRDKERLQKRYDDWNKEEIEYETIKN